MKDGIGEGYTRADHQSVANQLFSCYAKVGDARNLASVIGEDELSDLDKKYLEFGKAFEGHFVGQGDQENRSIIDTLEIGWDLFVCFLEKNSTVLTPRFLMFITIRRMQIQTVTRSRHKL